MIMKELIEINKRVCSNLWNLAYVGQRHVINKAEINGLSPKLVVPTYQRNGPGSIEESRISEQESRVLFCDALNSTNYFYSIETPTFCNYEFCNLKLSLGGEPGTSKGIGTSARSDLSIYQQNGSIPGQSELIKLVNVEFKAHNPDESYIYKDIVKLCFETNGGVLNGNWFHTLKNTDSGTIPSLFGKFIKSFDSIDAALKNEIVKGQKFPEHIKILFCFCVLEKKESFIRVFEWPGETQQSLSDYARNFFSSQGITNGALCPSSQKVLNQWECYNM